MVVTHRKKAGTGRKLTDGKVKMLPVTTPGCDIPSKESEQFPYAIRAQGGAGG